MSKMMCVPCFVVLLLGLGSCLSAEEAVVPAPLSLQQCIEIAMRSQTDVIVAQNNVTIAGSRLTSRTSAYLPQVVVQNNAFVTGSKGVLSQSTTGTALGVTQNIFDGGVREANVVGARYGVKQNRAALTRTRQTVTFDVTRAYYEVLRARHLAEVSEANVKYNQELRDQIESQAKEGTSALVDVLPIDAQLASAKVKLLSARNAVRTSALDLQVAMGVTPKSGFDVQEIEAMPDVEVSPLDTYVSAAGTVRPDVAQAEAGLGVARASVRAAKVALYPIPVVAANYQKSISGGFGESGTQMTGGLVFNLFDGGASRASYREARASQANAQQQADQLGRTIQAEVEEAYLNLTNSKERLDATQASLAASEKNLEAQRERYNQGLAITLDLLNAEVQLITSQSDAVQAKYDYYTAIAQMQYAVGEEGAVSAKQAK